MSLKDVVIADMDVWEVVIRCLGGHYLALVGDNLVVRVLLVLPLSHGNDHKLRVMGAIGIH
jgi:hypothetical protein